ncbi:variant erythrocyte surface antigen beta subunit, putative [Babesia ovis]|uniref:Variant erythrocyte surface antigen beta subunit, putative n=1 Tax=Babesia ovis TaxID=5869 RepID=A0A9W5WWP6_BABOV|nr:variant erythrocyte surface antigen beta subunit, putative [Babesia ovis]
MAAAAAAPGNKLTDSPTNLKEAIDWILRVTNKDGLNGDPKNHCWCDLADGVADLLQGIESQLTPEEKKIVQNVLDVMDNIGGNNRIRDLIDKVASQLAKFIGYQTNASGGSNGVGGDGAPQPAQNLDGNGIGKKGSYTSTYGISSTFSDESFEAAAGGEDDDIDENSTTNATRNAKLRCAKILLGCIPFIFSGLSYLCWTCADQRVGFSGNDIHYPATMLSNYIYRMGYDASQLGGEKVLTEVNRSKQFTATSINKVFGTCGIFGTEKPNNRDNYATYLFKLRNEASKKADELAQKLKEKGQDDTELNKNALIKLNILCAGYFRSLHRPQDLHCRNPRTPRTIREILYWLTSLPYCPIYRTLVPKVQEMFRVNGGEITFYSAKGKECKIDTENCVTYLLAGALAAPMVLLCIQDTIECLVGGSDEWQKKEVKGDCQQGASGVPGSTSSTTECPIAIHDLYANMQFYFSYPMSETQSYYLLQDCLVALYYQLYFLCYQCYWGRKSGYGWNWCRYGKDVQCDGCTSWICPVGNKKNYSHKECGQNPSASPLQAFLCDCLPGFACPEVKVDDLKEISTKYSDCYPEFLKHRDHVRNKPGQYCPIPMGFTGCFKTGKPLKSSVFGGDGVVGLGINAGLYYYAQNDLINSSLYQITRCISSLTRRVPRSTGTIFGFLYSLVDVYQKGVKQGGFNTKLDEELKCCPGSMEPSGLMTAVSKWRGGSHNNKTYGLHDKGTLDSLHNCTSDTCGKYLQPLTGSLYNSVAPQFCETYVSWIVHLTCKLKQGFIEFRDAFNKIDCKEAGCGQKPSGGSHSPDHCCTAGQQHSKCECTSVVECVGVHGLFYRFGFTYRDSGSMNGRSKKQCKDFHTQLGKVIDGQLFDNLFTQIRNFIYSTRALFGVYIGVYWSIVLVYLLWSMTVNLDLIHIRSHWKPARSYLVPLQRILADGSRKGFCTLGYFQEANGDRFLSLGVSDVYL